MSRAFVKESDDRVEDLKPLWSPLPSGTQNYITPSGAKGIQEQLDKLLEQKRATSETSIPEPERRKLESRIREHQQRIQTFVVTPPNPAEPEKVAFGATVTVRDESGEEDVYRIVGIDEVDLERDWISWQSPLARALMTHRAGDAIVFDAPAGKRQLQIVRVTYPG
jgi:transcription elongation factor GreB